MTRLLKLTLGGLFAASMIFPQVQAASDCEAKAVSKDGKPLAGAAKASSIKTCEADTKTVVPLGCADKTIDKNGKPLAGAAKNSFMNKCEADAKGGK